MGDMAVMIVGSRLLQQSLAVLMERMAGVAVLGGCRADEAVAMASDRLPDVVVIEGPAGGRPSLSHMAALTKLRPAPQVILVGRDPSREYIAAALELGVQACVSDEGGTEQLIKAFDAVRRSRRYVGPIIRDILQPRAGGDGGTGTSLTRRETEVLVLIADGKTELQIARELGLSPKTVHTHRTSIMSKLAVHNVTTLVRRAIRLGLVDL